MTIKVNQKVNQGTRKEEIALIFNDIQTLEYASGGRVVAGSNPVTPTDENEGVK